MTEQRVSVTITDGVADVRLTRPEKRNALDGAMFAGLVAAGERLKAEPGVRAVVLSGEGPDFCAGLDFGCVPGHARRRAAQRPASTCRRAAARPEAAGPARRVRLDRGPGPGHRRRDRERPGRRAADRARRRHPHRRPGRADVGAGDQVGPDTRHDRHPAAPRARRPGRGQGADLHRAHGAAARRPWRWAWPPGSTPTRARPPSSWPGRSPAAARTPSGRPSGSWTWPGRVDLETGFAAEQKEIGALIGSPNQAEAVAAEFEQRPPRFTDPG